MPEVLRTSYSRIKSWRRCHNQHYYKYILGIERKQPPLGIFKGKIMHDMLEAHLSGKNYKAVLSKYQKEYNKLFSAEKAELGDIPAEMGRIMANYLKYWKNDGLKYLKVEEKFEVKPSKNLIFVFQLDALVQDRKKRNWLFERKTPKKFPEEDVRMADLQTLLYVWGLEQSKIKVEGILWDYVRSKPPTQPEVLKRGGLSIAQNMDTDYDTYMGAIKKNKLNPKDYREKLKSLEGSEEKFFRRVYMTAPPDLVKILVNDMIKTSEEIQQNPTCRIRSLSFDCKQCMFHNLCQAELRGLDTDFILKSQYTKSMRGDSSETETEAEEE